MSVQHIAEIHRLGIPHFLRAIRDHSLPGNDQVIADWRAGYDENGLTAVGNVKPRSDTDVIDLLVVAFTSPNYTKDGQGTYYAGCFASIFSPPTTVPGTEMGFILQSQQFTDSDQGKTIAVQLQGLVNTTLFGFEDMIVIPHS